MLLNDGTWPSRIEDPAEVRDRYHRVALFEARINAEHAPHGDPASVQRSLVDRVRAALGIAPRAPQTIACSAC